MGVNFKKALRKETDVRHAHIQRAALSYPIAFCATHVFNVAGAVWSKLGKNGFFTNFMTKKIKMSKSDKSQDDSWWQL